MEVTLRLQREGFYEGDCSVVCTLNNFEYSNHSEIILFFLVEKFISHKANFFFFFKKLSLLAWENVAREASVS